VPSCGGPIAVSHIRSNEMTSTGAAAAASQGHYSDNKLDLERPIRVCQRGSAARQQREKRTFLLVEPSRGEGEGARARRHHPAIRRITRNGNQSPRASQRPLLVGTTKLQTSAAAAKYGGCGRHLKVDLAVVGPRCSSWTRARHLAHRPKGRRKEGDYPKWR